MTVGTKLRHGAGLPERHHHRSESRGEMEDLLRKIPAAGVRG
jgi:hypothetical protein